MSQSPRTWKPAPVPISSQWAAQVDPANPWPEYPRPQLAREAWTNLNGLWEYAIVGENVTAPTKWDGQILVPFAVESSLSGVGRRVNTGEALWYRRSFDAPTGEGRLLLNFGAVDWKCEVWVNDRPVGGHEGGFDPFTLDITDAAKPGANSLVIKVIDPSDDAAQPRGKQVRDPHGIWYTPVSGIWQTVWLERVPGVSIASLKITPDLDKSGVRIEIAQRGGSGASEATIEVLDGSSVVATATGKTGAPIDIALKSPKTWSPESPFLYDLKVTLAGSKDVVKSYFGLRKISYAADKAGYLRLHLNNKPVFMFGPLDQGWWPDGLYTAPTDEALRYDIEITKQFGFNMARKHIKLEPDRWYYWADRLGLLVWQDMPSGGIGARMREYYIHGDDPDSAAVTDEQSAVFQRELKAIIDAAYNHPSIIVWVPFNEGWFQHRTNEILKWTKAYDPSRLVDGPSGWTDRGFGDLHDMHRYPGPDMFVADGKRVSVLGEYGGFGLPVPGHMWQEKKNWGYITIDAKEKLAEAYRQLNERLAPLAQRGLAAAVYTQTTDVEGEINGLLTYDRKVFKLDPQELSRQHAAVIRAAEKPVRPNVLTEVSRYEATTYRVATDTPTGAWTATDFDDSAWPAQQGGIRGKDRHGYGLGEGSWTSPAIWARREVTLKAAPAGDVFLRVGHDQDATVYLNGVLVAELKGAAADYREIPLPAAARATLKAGKNVLAVHSTAGEGQRMVDVGLLETTAV